MKNKQNKKINTKGFTLLELLVVVLIIGILAAIAIPQYKMSVGRTQFTMVKNFTKNIVESLQRYYLVNNVYPSRYTQLDISFDGIKGTYSDSQQFSFSVAGGISCSVWFSQTGLFVACSREIFGKTISYYVYRDTNKPHICRVIGIDPSNMANRLCQIETGRKKGTCENGGCYYVYR